MFGYFSPDRWASKEGKKCHEIAINPEYVARVTLIELMQTLVHEMAHCWQYCYGKPSVKSYHNKQWSNKMKSIGLMPSSTGQPGGAFTGQNMMDYPLPGGKFIKECEIMLKTESFKMIWVDARARPHLITPDDDKMAVIKEALNDIDGEVAGQLTSSLYDLFGQPEVDDGDDEAMSDLLNSLLSDKNDDEEKKKKRKIKYTCPTCHINLWGKPELNVYCGDCDEVLKEVAPN
jgi:predicted SprT family Zn-dependent metalloprotease